MLVGVPAFQMRQRKRSFSVAERAPLKAGEHNLAPGTSAFDQSVGFLQVRRVDRAEFVIEGSANDVCVDQLRDTVQSSMLLWHGRCVEE